MSINTRMEKDALGEVWVPGDRLWGAQTQRCLDCFKIGSERMPFALIRALAAVRRQYPEEQSTKLSRLSVSARDNQSHGVALPQVYLELAGHR